MRSSLGQKRAFTLVELLVVIGIIAVLISVLLPALSKARGRAQTVACLSNLRQVVQACVNYTVEYKGSYPYGFTFNKTNPTTGRPSDSGASGYITWFSSCDKYMKPKETEIILLDYNTGIIDGGTQRKFSDAFKCPVVDQGTFKQQVHFYQHGVVMPHLTLELPAGFRAAGLPAIKSPAKVNQVYPDTALFWDAPLYGGAAAQTPAMFWGSDHTVAGYAAFCSMIDDNATAMSSENGLLCHPNLPERRFRGSSGDRFGGSTNPLKAPSGPIAFASDQYLQSIGAPYPSANTDFGGGEVWNPGNARFRHNGLGCNVAFVDGSVRTMFLNPRRAISGSGAATYNDCDFRRYMLMIKWPTGMRDTGAYPTN